MDFVDLGKLDYVAKKLENEKENLISLLPSRFSNRLREELFVSGGCIYSLYNNQEPKDIDTLSKAES